MIDKQTIFWENRFNIGWLEVFAMELAGTNLVSSGSHYICHLYKSAGILRVLEVGWNRGKTVPMLITEDMCQHRDGFLMMRKEDNK